MPPVPELSGRLWKNVAGTGIKQAALKQCGRYQNKTPVGTAFSVLSENVMSISAAEATAAKGGQTPIINFPCKRFAFMPYYRKQVLLPIVECGAKGAPFIGSEEIASDKTYYRKQVLLPIVECGAKGAPFIGSKGIASDKTYYRNRFANPVIGLVKITASSHKT